MITVTLACTMWSTRPSIRKVSDTRPVQWMGGCSKKVATASALCSEAVLKHLSPYCEFLITISANFEHECLNKFMLQVYVVAFVYIRGRSPRNYITHEDVCICHTPLTTHASYISIREAFW